MRLAFDRGNEAKFSVPFEENRFYAEPDPASEHYTARVFFFGVP